MLIKKVGRALFLSLLLLLTLVASLAIWIHEHPETLYHYKSIIFPNSIAKVLSYKPAIEKELDKYHLKEFTPILLAIMYQESQGQGNDPMQASESAGLKRNEIQDPAISIQQGVFHFYKMYTLGKKKGVDIETIIQSYNMGPGYIVYVSANGYKHKKELAKAYSKMQVDKNPTLYTCGGFKGNFRYPYCFGDYTYVAKIQEAIPRVKKG